MTQDHIDAFAVPLGRTKPGSDHHRWFGFSEHISIEIRFSTGQFFIKLIVGAEVVWGKNFPDGQKFDHVAFVNFFSANWNALWLETFPGNISARTTLEWLQEAQVKRGRRRTPYAETQALWDAFRSKHCLSGLIVLDREGDLPPDVWLVGAPDTTMLVDIPRLEINRTISIGTVLSAFERSCDMIADCLLSSPSRNPADEQCIAQWNAREKNVEPRELVGLFTGIDNHGIVEALAQEIGPQSARAMLRHQSELLAAARMRPGNVSSTDIKIIIDSIRSAPLVRSDYLDEVSAQSLVWLETSTHMNGPPGDQGRLLARWFVDDFLRLDPMHVEPEVLLRDLSVEVSQIRLDTDRIDAIAFWGPKHGPAILLNNRGTFARSKAARRATLAHEICHLLIDRKRNLPLADVVGGEVPRELERRAKAFAAELLLPAEKAFGEFSESDTTAPLVKEKLGKLVARFRVSTWMAAIQSENGILRYADNPRKFGDTLAILSLVIAHEQRK